MRSLDFLGIEHLKAAMDEARTMYKFGILTCNGLDFDFQEPITT